MISLIKYLFKIIKILIFVTLTALIVVFFSNNSQDVRLSLSPFPYEAYTKLFLIAILFFALGLLFGFLAGSRILVKSKYENWINRWRIKFLTKKNKQREVKVIKSEPEIRY